MTKHPQCDRCWATSRTVQPHENVSCPPSQSSWRLRRALLDLDHQSRLLRDARTSDATLNASHSTRIYLYTYIFIFMLTHTNTHSRSHICKILLLTLHNINPCCGSRLKPTNINAPKAFTHSENTQKLNK